MDTAGAPREPQCSPDDNQRHGTLCPLPLRPRDLLLPSTPSGKPGPQEPPGTKPFHLGVGWVLEGILALASAEHLCWALWEVAVCSPHPGQLDIFFTPKGPPSPGSCSQAGAWQRGSGHSRCQLGVWWSLVLSKDESTIAGDPLGEVGGIYAFTASLKHSCCAWGFSFFSIWFSLSQAAMGRSPFTCRVSKERPNVSTWGSTHVLSPLLQPLVAEGEGHVEKYRNTSHASPSHHNSLSCFQKMLEVQGQVVHKSGLNPHHRCINRYT